MPPEQDTDPQLTTADRIRTARRRANLEQTEVAKALGVSRSLVSRWENAHGLPDVEQGALLAQLFEVSFGWLFGVPVRSRCYEALRATVRERRAAT